MSRNGSTWPGTLPTLRKKVFQIPSLRPHASFGRFKRFLRRREQRSAHRPPSLATHEGDHNLSRRPSSVFTRRAVGDYGGSSTNTVGCLYDINTSLPFLDVATANADTAVSADECNAYQNYASTSSAPPPLSALSGGFFAGSDLKDLPSSTSVGLSEMDVVPQHSFLGAGALFAANRTASASQAGPSAHPFLSDLQPPNALGLQFVDYSEEIVVPRPSYPRMNYVPLPPLSPSPELPSNASTHACKSTNGQYEYETIYETPVAANDDEPTNEQYQDTTHQSSASSYRTAPESLSPQREHQPEIVPETLVPSIAQTIISEYFKPRKLVIDREISLIDIQSVLSALRHCLQDLTIGPIGVGPPTSLSATATIDLSHVTSLKLDQVDFSFLKELLVSVRMDSLTVLDLRFRSPEVMPRELNLAWRRLTNVILRDNFRPEVMDQVMGSLRDVIRLKWLGKLVSANGREYSYNLKSLQDLSIRSNEDGCAFFLENIHSVTLQTLHLSHLSPFIRGRRPHGLLGVRNLSIEHEIDADQFLSTLHHFPALSSADIGISGTMITEISAMQQQFARLESLTLRSVFLSNVNADTTL